MTTKWDDTSWQQDFLRMKRHAPDVERLLIEGPKGFRDAWQLGSLHQEYKRLKKKYHLFQAEEEEQQN